MQNDKIDFVITWVDGNDPEWQKEKNEFIAKNDGKFNEKIDTRKQRYRDWDNLRYWFRGIEQYANWVNKIYFVTWGHVPSWLNTDNPKLVIVKHKDYLPQAALPCYNSGTLELYLNRIKNLSEKFVYFNDDMFIIDKVNENDFFKNNLPVDNGVLNVHCYSEDIQWHFGYEQAVGVINKYFDFKKSIKNNWRKWFSPKNGISKNLRTAILMGCPRFPGIWQHHAPWCMLKSTLDEVWNKEYENLSSMETHHFRNKLDYTLATMKAWQLASGKFEPRNYKLSKSYMIQKGQSTASEVADAIRKKKNKIITINDGELSEEQFEDGKKKILVAFQDILPNKSSFEK
ncbi:stealth family protein [Ligilactobacillus agilis]|uniref:stealth family protein n=1 Tax=Ligilactobacillus agilis TaxID=1601 RepID=UPI001559B389|nr:stealth family protein [Ligilactobacillus agilis]